MFAVSPILAEDERNIKTPCQRTILLLRMGGGTFQGVHGGRVAHMPRHVALRAIVAVRKRYPECERAILGFFLEGPFISSEPDTS